MHPIFKKELFPRDHRHLPILLSFLALIIAIPLTVGLTSNPQQDQSSASKKACLPYPKCYTAGKCKLPVKPAPAMQWCSDPLAPTPTNCHVDSCPSTAPAPSGVATNAAVQCGDPVLVCDGPTATPSSSPKQCVTQTVCPTGTVNGKVATKCQKVQVCPSITKAAPTPSEMQNPTEAVYPNPSYPPVKHPITPTYNPSAGY